MHRMGGKTGVYHYTKLASSQSNIFIHLPAWSLTLQTSYSVSISPLLDVDRLDLGLRKFGQFGGS